jgi:hypothetical protein
MHLGSAPRIPCPLRRLVPALFPAADAGCAILGYPCRRKTCCTIYSGIHTPALCYQLLSSPLCAFLGFLLLRHYVRMSATLPSVVLYTGVDALRQLATMQPWPPSLPAEAHKLRLSPSTYICRAALVPFAVSRLHVFLRSGSSVLHS